ncbi:hypothetical protein TI10_22320 [Photorhabdus luminescens subsp. luminescens]|uniref:Uncharacterized protein n=2 Tax=Photorhabdus TaxID=29487 RepID=A0A2S8QAG4_PHOLU|nr:MULTISPECIES: hypothetical protein [Photorhabdus]KMW71134.1 hypothetical protein TI10_22320 [Photorhabdus luminescens subsp. luminescens]MBS9427835.1 hypothetical protein [Photorhabdus akhurstii]OCA54240.1 hypothetical protein Phpb_02684 [Photorhabdus namnaonensis]PQQ30622.1 hypothetical protein C6H69_16555 [Photorhabdus luminescens]SCZ61212.1 hypothetical protein SAMN02982990_01677 [Photorhabdus luminescens]
MSVKRPKPLVIKMPDCPVVFCLPYPKLTLSAYAEVTGQTVRTVQQQANEQKLILTKKKKGREREVNMVYEFLEAYEEAQEALRMKF